LWFIIGIKPVSRDISQVKLIIEAHCLIFVKIQWKICLDSIMSW